MEKKISLKHLPRSRRAITSEYHFVKKWFTISFTTSNVSSAIATYVI